MSDLEHNIIIQPNVGNTNSPEIDFISADASSNAKTISLKVYPTSNGTLSFEGNTGQLFSITDSMSGTIFSVNDISGIPSIEVLDTGLVKLAEYSGNVAIGTETANYKLDVQGDSNISGTYKIANTTVLTSSALGSGITSSSLTSVGIITSGTWSGSFGAVSGANLTTLNASNISSGTLPNARLSSIPNSALAANTISGVTLGNNLNALTISSPLSGTSYNGSGAVSIGLSSGYGDTQNPFASKTANYFLAAPNGTAGVPTFRAIVGADIPTLNQNTTGSAGSVVNSVTFNNGGAGDASGTTFNGSAARTISHNTLGALALTGGSLTGQLISTDTWDTTTGGGNIYLNSATGNRIDWNGNGIGAPAFTTRSAGTKLVLYPGVAAAAVDYALGIENSNMWFSTAENTTSGFKWYHGTTNTMSLLATGILSVVTGFRINNAATSGQYLRGNGTNFVSSAIQAADVPTLNQNTTGSAATLTTTRTLWGQNFNGSGNVTGNLTSVGDITGTSTLGLYSTTTSALNIDSGTTGAINIGTNANAKTITLGNVTGATSFVVNSGTSGVIFNQVATGIFKVQASAAPTTDMVQITNAGQAIATAGINALEVTFVGGAAAVEAGAIRTGFTPGTTTGGTWNGFRMVPTAAATTGVTMNGMKFDNITAGTGTDNMIYAGTGWDNIINYNGTSIINGSGQINASQLLTGTVPGDRGVTSGSATSSFVEYNGTTATAGQFDGGTTTPTGTTRLNYGGYFYPTFINLIGSADTTTTATHYFVETGSDGYVRPKTLVNVKTELLGNQYITFSGPTAARTYTLPDASGTILTSTNYNSYSPTLTGGGASGSWGINVTGSSASCTGNAATATTATYLTTTQLNARLTGQSNSLAMAVSDSTNLGSFVAKAGGTGDANLAGMTFWNDSYAIKLGIRNDGVFGLGGWSRAAWSWYSDSAGNMVAAGNVTAYSDPRLKENFEKINNPLYILEQLDGGTFTWKKDIPHIQGKAGKRDYGILADQVEKVMPEIVTDSIEIEGETYKTVAYEKLVPVLIEAIKELSNKIKELEGKNAKI